MNAYDSAFMQELFLKKGYSVAGFGEDADIVVVNTCTVTAVADKKSRAAIRKAAGHGKVIVTGCLAQKQASRVLAMDGVCAAVGTDERARIADIAERVLDGETSIDFTHGLDGCGYEDMALSTPGEKTRGTIKIQEGCDNFCSYCIIPYVRGAPRSRRLSGILEEAQTLADGGAKEIVLTGIHLASYADGESRLADVITALGKIDGIRVRLGSIEPGFLSEAFVAEAASVKNFCPHFHLSLQSGSAGVLRRMNRKYTPEKYIDFVGLLRRYFDMPAVTTDIIAGFPAETRQEHEETCAFVKTAAFSRIHVFPFSAREGTKAYDMMPKVPKAEARERALELILLGEESEIRYLQNMIGRREEVLFEAPSDAFEGCFEGYTRRYFRAAATAQANDLKTVTLKDICGKIVFGDAITE